jgi:predicted N-formylglutamate amidohydrolase
VPAAYAPLFAAAAGVLDSHRGLDYGALEVARSFGRRLGVTPETATVSRLVCDLNRSPYHRNLFSEFTRSLGPEARERVLARHYWPYRQRVEAAVVEAVTSGDAILHVSSHSFTPVLNGEVRRCDVGFLYDPRQPRERAFVAAWHEALAAAAPELVLRRNYPYKGVSDALVTHLRRRYAARGYVGVEIEVNQKHVGAARWRALVGALTESLAAAVARYPGLPP